jgi:hypothetical protein
VAAQKNHDFTNGGAGAKNRDSADMADLKELARGLIAHLALASVDRDGRPPERAITGDRSRLSREKDQ